MSKFSGVGRGLFMQPNSTDPEVGRASSPTNKDLLSPGPPKLVSYEEDDDAPGEDKDSSEHFALPEESTEDSCAGDGVTEEATKELPQSSECEPPPDQNSNMIDDAVESREPEVADKPEAHVVDKPEDAQAPPLEDHTSTSVDNDICESEPSASPNQDKAPECDENVPSAVVPLLETNESMIADADAIEEKAEGDDGSNIEGTEESPDDPARVTSIEGETAEPKSDEDAKDDENESATIESESTETKASAEMPEKPKIQIAANLNSGSPTTMSPTTSPDIPLLPSPMKVPGAGILGPAPNAPLLPRGPPSMFPKALPISIPPPPMDFRLPPPKVVPKTKEELLQMLTEQVGIIQPPDEKGSTDQGRGKTASSDDQNPKQQPKKQQYPQRQQQQQQQPGQQWQNSGRDNNWRQKTDPNMRMPQQGMPNMQNRQPNTTGKKPSPQGGTKPGFSNLTKDELEKEYQWQKFSVERKIKKILKSMKTSSDEEVIKELLTIIKYNPSKLANFPWPKEQYVVLEKLIEHAILNTDNEESLQKRVATIINSLQDMHPQGFKEDLKNAILHEQGEYIQGSSSEFRRNQARSAGHFLGELYSLSRASSTEFKASVQSVVALTLKDWIKAPNVATISEDSKLLLEVYAQCLEEFLVLTLRDNDEHLKKQVLTLLKEEILSTTRPIEAKTLLLDTLFKLACHGCTARVPTEGQKTQQSLDNRETKIYSGSSEPSPGKTMSYNPQQPKTQPITPQKPNNQHDVKQYPQQHQQRKQQQHPPLSGSKFTSPPPSGLSQVQGRLPPGQHPMNFPQGGPVNMSTPPPNMNAPPPTMSQSGHNIPRWPAASQGPPMPSSIPAASTSTGVVLLNQLQQQIQQQQQLGYMNQSIPASMQTPQGPVPIPQAQIPQGGSQRHSHGLGASIQMLQQGAFPDPQGMPSQQVLGNMVPQAPSIPPSQASGMSSMMQSNSQTNPHIMSGVPGQQMMQSGNVQMMQYSSAGTTPGHPVQSSSQFLRNLPMSVAPQMSTSMNYQQQEDFANQMGQMMLSGSDPWHQSGVGVTQAVTAPIFSTAQGVNPSGHRQEMLSAPPGNPEVQSSQEDMSGQPSFAQSAASGRFVQNRIPEAAPKQSFQNSDDAMHGVSQWGVSPQGSAWPDKLPDSNQLPTTSPPSFTSQNQNPNQWSADGRNVKSPEAVSDTPSQEPSASGWGDANQGPQESSQQRLGTDGWGSSNPSPGVGNWGAEPQPTDSWNGHATSFPGHQTGAVQHSSAEHPDMGPRGFPNQPRMPNQVSAQANAVKAPPKDKYVFEESASSVSGYQRPNAYTLPSKHKEGSPAAEGVSYNAMSELGSYGIGPSNSYDSSSYGGAYTAIRDGGGYGDSFPPEGQKVGNFVLLPENTQPQNSASPDHFEISAIRDCFMDEEEISSYEMNAYQNQMRFRQQHGQPNWSQFETQKEKHVPSALHGRSPRDNSQRGHGRGSLLVTNPCTAMPPFPPPHPPGSRQPPIKQKYQPRN